MKFKEFDVVELLHSEEDIQMYLKAVLESGASAKAIRQAFDEAERARAKLRQQEPNIETVEMIFNALMNSKLLSTMKAVG